MKKIKDERVKLPPFIVHLLLCLVGVIGLIQISGGHPDSLIDSLTILLASIFSGLAFWGAVSIICDIKEGKTWKGFIKVIKRKLIFEPYERTRDS
jgi:hypothetical protein